MINVTKTYTPPFSDYLVQVKRAFENQWLTNRGELVLELEQKLNSFLQTSNICITANGTLPLQIALKLLGNRGEIITSPFSYVATTAAIVWEGCTPVFVDIHPEYLTIDETKIEAAITSKTTTILATNVFGNPCKIEVIDGIAKKYGLKVIYDSAHCFAVKYAGKSIFSYGDVSTCSFHATKLFHTAEGGAMFCENEELRHKLFYSHNFGHNGPLEFYGLGINAKISELQAAMGLAVFPYIEMLIEERKRLVELYCGMLDSVPVQRLKIRENTEWNYSYFPVIFKTEQELLIAQQSLNHHNIFPRRYFYPSLNTLPYARGNTMPVSESIVRRILCLPLYVGLQEVDLHLICKCI